MRLANRYGDRTLKSGARAGTVLPRALKSHATQSLIIDLTLVEHRELGGNDGDQGNVIAVDGSSAAEVERTWCRCRQCLPLHACVR